MAANKPSYEQLIALAAGELSSADAAAVSAAIAADSGAKVDLAFLRRVIETMRADDSVAAPEAQVAEAQSIFKPKAAASVLDWLSDLGRAVATVVFDSRIQPALAGFRRGAAANDFSLSFELGETEIDLQIHLIADGAGGCIRGQIHLMPPFEGCQIALIGPGGELVAQGQPDREGMFVLEAPRGRYELLIRMADRIAALPGIDVGR